MSLYDGLSVETAPIPEIIERIAKTDEEDEAGHEKSESSWSSGFQLMASQIQRNKRASRKPIQKPRPQVSSAVLDKTGSIIQPESDKLKYYDDDLAGEIEDEYNPMLPNNYLKIVQERKAESDKIREEERKKRMERDQELRRRRRLSGGESSDSDSEKPQRRRKARDDERPQRNRSKDSAAAIPPPSTLQTQSSKSPEGGNTVIQSALEELSRKKAKRANPFGKPKFGAVASKIMSKYGWEEGQGLGKTSQGISIALSVEKTGRRGGKIVNTSADIEEQIQQDKKKIQSMTDVMKNPTKVVLLQNMVGPGEVDDDLEPETAEECTKYGEVEKCVIFEIPHGAPDYEAVRIFVGFVRLEAAIKAVIDINGRFFGGRTVRASFFPEDRFRNFDLAP